LTAVRTTSSPTAAVPLAPSGPLLAVHAHPDDETLSTGGLLATWALSGQPVTVVTCTRGERGEVIDSATHPTGVGHLEGDGPALAAYRERELAGALTALGVADHVLLDRVPEPTGPGGPAPSDTPYEDSGMSWVAPGIAGPAADAPATAFARVPLDEAAARLAAVVRDRRPAVVVTYEPGGGYGHPDHVRAHEVTVRALELAADPGADVAGEPWRVVERWEPVVAESRLRDARRALAATPGALRLVEGAGLTLPDADEPLPPVAFPDAVLDDLARQGRLVTVDVAPVFGPVLAAMRAHATQVQHATAADRTLDAPGGAGRGLLGWYALSNAVLAPLTSTETYAVRPVGAPVGSAR
jgi:N-acetyl-1-D-myo-inositol-2-amino-2-deoxy-alpha-D-glucopyranoside deacetylase